MVRVAIQDVFLGTTKRLFVFLHGKIRFEISNLGILTCEPLLARFFNSKTLRLWKDVVIKFLSKTVFVLMVCKQARQESLGHAALHRTQNVPLVIRIPKSRIRMGNDYCPHVSSRSRVSASGYQYRCFQFAECHQNLRKPNDYHPLKSAPCTYLLGFLGIGKDLDVGMWSTPFGSNQKVFVRCGVRCPNFL